MSVGPLALLRMLSGGIGAIGRAASSTPPSASVGGDFQAMLDRARQGEVESGLPVTIDDRAGVTLTDDQLRRLAVAADRAEAQGATRALVLIDGMALRLDVGLREVTGVAELKGNAPLTGIDAVISVPGPEGSGAAGSDAAGPSGDAGPRVLPLPRSDSASLNRSLLESLSRAGAR